MPYILRKQRVVHIPCKVLASLIFNQEGCGRALVNQLLPQAERDLNTLILAQPLHD